MLTFDLLQAGKLKLVPNDDKFDLRKTRQRKQIDKYQNLKDTKNFVDQEHFKH